MTPHLARIDIYPVKSLEGVTVPQATVLSSGALQHDRAWAFFDAADRVINAKRLAAIHRVRSRFTEAIDQVTVGIDTLDDAVTFRLPQEQAALASWFSSYCQQSVRLEHNTAMGFPDDTVSPGPTVISTATLDAIASWCSLPLAEVRQRLRTNLEIDGVPAFWEDQLFAANDDPVPFQVGSVTLQGINPCQRCVVPTRHPQTGAATPGFQQQFTAQRSATLPAGVARSRFNHFYRVAVNTRIPHGAGQVLRVGDPVRLL